MSVKKIYWLFQISGWTLYASVNIFFIIIGPRPLLFETIVGYVLLGLFFILSTHYYRRMIKRLGWIRLDIFRLIPRVLISVFLLSCAFVLFEILIVTFLWEVDENLFIAILMNVLTAMILYIAWSMIYFLYHYIHSYNKSLKYEAAMNEIELNRLKSQLNPHFMFNALNSIRALVDEDPARSKHAITQLSNILRNSLTTDKNRLVSLADEMNTVKDYLDLEKIRYEERLKTEVNIHADTLRIMIPPLMIQTLVENGIKHGISKLKEGGIIRINTFAEDNLLVVQIRNSGQYTNGKKQREGYGISNTLQRLSLIYGPEARFKIINESEHTVLTEIKIPKNH